MKVNIKLSEHSKGLLNQMVSKQFIAQQMLPKLKLPAFAQLWKMNAEAEIQQSVGESIGKHFKVTIRGTNQYGINLVVMGDDLANIYYEGTEDEYVISTNSPSTGERWWPYNNSLVMKFNVGGLTLYRDEVVHPRIKPLARKVQNAVERARKKTMAEMGIRG